jgi:hypothetical protein
MKNILFFVMLSINILSYLMYAYMHTVYTACIYIPVNSYPDRHWSTVDELELPETEPFSGKYMMSANNGYTFGPEEPYWTYGPSCGKRDSFYCTHISGCQRLKNGNTLGKV